MESEWSPKGGVVRAHCAPSALEVHVVGRLIRNQKVVGLIPDWVMYKIFANLPL